MAGINVSKVYEAFGLDQPTDTGVNEQNPAESAEASQGVDNEGEKAQGIADPALQSTQTPDTDAVSDPEPDVDAYAEGEDVQEGKKPLSAEERRANAARRREQERQDQQKAIDDAVAAAENRVKEQYDERMQSFFTSAKLKDTFTGEPITTMDQFEAWQKKYQEEQFRKKLAAGNLTPDDINAMIQRNPVIQQAQQMVQQADAQKQAAQDQAFSLQVEKELEEIRKMDPSVKTLQDLLKLPKADMWREKVVNEGLSYLDAYKLVYEEENQRRVAEAARQSALNNARSKDHLKATGARGTGSVPVPAAEMRYYRMFNPKMSDAEISAHYNKKMKQGGK